MKLALQVVDFHWPGGPERIGPTLAAIDREVVPAVADPPAGEHAA